MRYLNLLIQTVNALRQRGLLKETASLDRILRRNAQELGDLGGEEMDLGGGKMNLGGGGGEEGGLDLGLGEKAPVAEKPEVPVAEDVLPNLEKMQRTLYYMFSKWHQVLDRELPRFEYLGDDNVDAMRSQLRNVRQAFDAAMERKPQYFDKPTLDNWNGEVAEKVREMHQSQKMPLNETKAKVDAFLIYRTTKDLYDKFLRLCKDDSTFGKVKEEFSSLIHVFANVVQNTLEEIAKVDLTEER